MSKASLQTILQRIGPKVGLPDLSLDGDDYCLLRIGDTSPSIEFIDNGELAIFTTRWGTPMNQPEKDRTWHNAVPSLAGKLDAATQKLAQSGKTPAGRRIIVMAESSFHGSRWAWLPAGGSGEPLWHAGRGSAVVNALAEMVSLA